VQHKKEIENIPTEKIAGWPSGFSKRWQRRRKKAKSYLYHIAGSIMVPSAPL
jgi:hypothetical protein